MFNSIYFLCSYAGIKRCDLNCSNDFSRFRRKKRLKSLLQVTIALFREEQGEEWSTPQFIRAPKSPHHLA